jgi:putative FmdB family regulatory protein
MIAALPIQWAQWEFSSRRGKRTLPLYAYRCTQCGHRFEKIQNFSAEPETECPECHGVLERPLTAPGLSFKGAGWYVNDYAAKSSASGDSDSKAEAKADAKSDAKAAAKDAAKETKPASGATESQASQPAAPTTPATKSDK